MQTYKINELPKISIVTVVYNNVQYIKNCVRSVLDQNYPKLEYIVIDGGSSDGTIQIIEKFKDRLTYFVSEKDRGQTHALNKGFSKATGDVFAWINADEQYLPGTLWEVCDAFKNDPNLDFFFGNRIIINSRGEEIGRKKMSPMHPKWHLLYKRHVLPTDASFWNERVHRLTGELDEVNFPRVGMDIDWLLRLSVNVNKWKYTKKYLSKFTERPDRITKQHRKVNPNRSKQNHYLARERLFSKYPHMRIEALLGKLVVQMWSMIYKNLSRGFC